MTDAKNEIAQAKANAALKAAETPQDYSDYVTDPAPCTFVEMLEGAQENMALEKVGRLATQLPGDLAGLVAEARLDAKAFREHTVYDSEGDPIRLGANADRLDKYADTITALSRQLAEREAEIARLSKALVDHNGALRSAQQVAFREGAETNWLSLRGHFTWVLAEHHDLSNEARRALENGHG